MHTVSVCVKSHLFDKQKKTNDYAKYLKEKEWLIPYLNQAKCLGLLQAWDTFEEPLQL